MKAQSRWIRAAGVVLVACLQGCTQARSENPADPYSLSAQAFFATERVNEPLRMGQIDRRLLSAAVFHATNVARAEHDLPLLRHDARLDQAADTQARSMREHGYVGHENTFEEDLRWPMDRVREAGYVPVAVSENVAQVFREKYEPPRLYYKVEGPMGTVFSYTPDGEEPIPPHTYASFARFVVDQWMDSPGHRENILRPESEALGAAARFRDNREDLDEAYVAQIFAQPMQRGRGGDR